MNIDTLLDLFKPKFIKGHSLDKELIVSITSYPNRFSALHLSIASLLNQTVSPDRIILWLFKEDYQQLPAAVKSLEKFGLQIHLIKEDWKSYKKIIPTLLNYPDSYIVTCDDDIIFKPTLIEELVEFYKKTGGIVAHRAHIIQFDKNKNILPYDFWLKNTPSKDFYEINSPFVFPTSGAGVLYPPNCFDASVVDIHKALALCPTADDIWLFYMASMRGSRASLIGERNFIDLNADSNESLWAINSKGENDRQFNKLVSEFGLPKSLEIEICITCENIQNVDTVKIKNGRSLRVLNDHIGRIVKRTELFYENDLITFVKRFIAPKSVVDVGTNIGNHAVGFSGHPQYNVICFEPDSKLAEVAKINFEMNSINYKIHNHGLGRKEEKLPFVPGSNENSGVGKFDRESNSPTCLTVKRMDDCIQKDSQIDLIKIDVEGFELDVLLGAEITIKNNLPMLVIEHQSYESYVECKELLFKLAYKPIRVFCATPTFVYINTKKYGFINSSDNITWVDGWSDFSQATIISE
jgi:FkbM family methyltransferase